MTTLRVIIRVLLITGYTLSTYTVYLTGYAVCRSLHIRFEPWRNLFMRVWSIGMSWILNIHVQTSGTPPDPPFILVSNHLSYIDIVPLYLNLECTFVAKKEVRSWPFLGFMIKSTGVIFVDRTLKKDVTRVNEVLSKSLNRYQGVIMFPEGTTSGGENVLPFRPSLLQFPVTQHIPVYYASIRYETDEKKGDQPAERSVCFYGAREPIHKHILKLSSNKRINCTLRFGEEPLQSNDRKELAEKLHEGVKSIFEPMNS